MGKNYVPSTAVIRGEDRIKPIFGSVQERDAFEHWYANGRDVEATAETKGLEAVRVRNWKVEHKWNRLADERDARVEQRLAERAVKQRVEQQQEYGQFAALFRAKVLEFLENNGPRTATEAVQMMRLSMELDAKSHGIPDWLMGLLGGTDEHVAQFAAQLGVTATAAGDSAPPDGAAQHPTPDPLD